MKTISTAIKNNNSPLEPSVNGSAPTAPKESYPELRLTGDAAKAIIEESGETGSEIELVIKAKIVSKTETKGASRSYRPDETSVELEITSIGDEGSSEEEMGEEMGGSAEEAISGYRASKAGTPPESEMD